MKNAREWPKQPLWPLPERLFGVNLTEHREGKLLACHSRGL
jgi:hypothetical protein